MKVKRIAECSKWSILQYFLSFFEWLYYTGFTVHRVPTSTGKPGKSKKEIPCMEKSWNLKKTEKSWKNHGIL